MFWDKWQGARLDKIISKPKSNQPFRRGGGISKVNTTKVPPKARFLKASRVEISSPTVVDSTSAEVAEEESSPALSVTLPNLQPSLINSQPAGGELSRYIINWRNITKDSFVLNVVSEGYKIQILNSDIYLCSWIFNL